jgi:predicted Zn-dependent protease
MPVRSLLFSDTAVDTERPRFLSEADCRDIADRLTRAAQGGGYTAVHIASTWTGNVRWSRNQIVNGGEVRDNMILVTRNLQGGIGRVRINDTTDVSLIAAARQAERLAMLRQELSQSDLIARLPLEPHATPSLFDNATYQSTASQRADAALQLTQQAATKQMLSAGYIEVMARSLAALDTEGRTLYFPYTAAQYSVTVRDPKGTASGWAGVDQTAWSTINATQLTTTALDKCLQSQHAVRVEPGRYTTILEPQAVGDLVGQLFGTPAIGMDPMNLSTNLYSSSRGPGPFYKTVAPPLPGETRLGERVVDERITVSSDPMDPMIGFPPFALVSSNAIDEFAVPVYHPVTWIDRGVLTHLAYNRTEAIVEMGGATGLPNSGAFRMSGGETSIEEMILTTKRGILVTRFDQLQQLDFTSQLYRGYTRDGLWLIENGKISKAIKNLVFTESVLFALNNIDQLGVPKRIFHPGTLLPFYVPQPRVVPAIKVRDFSFTALTDAV